MKPAILTPLRHTPFRLLFAGQLISDLGDWLDFLALISLIVYRWKLGPGALAAFSVTVALPSILIAPVAGVWVDRWPRKTVMVICDLLRAPIVLGLIWAANLPTVLVLVFAKAAVSTFFSPARQATIASTVPEDDLLSANSLSQLSVQLMKVLGPALGGLLVALAGPRAAFGVDAATFLASALFLSRLPHLQRVQADAGTEQAEGFWQEFRAGFAFLVHSRVLSAAIASMSAAIFVIFTFDSLGVLALKALGVGEGLFGLAVAGIGMGTVFGAITISQWGKRFNPFGVMGIGQILGGAVVALLGGAVIAGLRGTSFLGILSYMLIGLSAAAVFVPYSYIIQVETPEALMGRVFASGNGIQTVFQLLAPPLGAALAEIWGIGALLIGAGIALAVLGLAVSVLRPKLAPAQDAPAPGLV